MARSLAWVEGALTEAGQLVRSRLAGREEDGWFGGAIDSRGDCTGRVFFALKGEHADGHDFVGAAVDHGASAVVIEREDTGAALDGVDTPFFLVKHVLAALQEMSRSYRSSLDVRVIAVTGSAGKTSTKEYIRSILKKKYRVHSNAGNLNNHIGVPLTVLETSDDSEYLVSEVAANHRGEIEFLSRLLRPDVGVITNIGDAHIGLFGGRDNIARAKGELFTGIDAGGYAVLPGDDDYFEVLEGLAGCRVVTFGEGDASDYRLSAIEARSDGYEFQVNGQPVMIRRFGRYDARNACAAFAVGELCGVELERIREALGETEPMPGRSLVYNSPDYTLIDDSYNANPTSMRAAIDALTARKGGRRIAVLGDMGELGEFAEELHRELGNYIAGSGVDLVFWFGEYGQTIKEGTIGKKDLEVHTFVDFEALMEQLQATLKVGDSILVKASRASLLDRVVDRLRTTLFGEGEA